MLVLDIIYECLRNRPQRNLIHQPKIRKFWQLHSLESLTQQFETTGNFEGHLLVEDIEMYVRGHINFELVLSRDCPVTRQYIRFRDSLLDNLCPNAFGMHDIIKSNIQKTISQESLKKWKQEYVKFWSFCIYFPGTMTITNGLITVDTEILWFENCGAMPAKACQIVK